MDHKTMEQVQKAGGAVAEAGQKAGDAVVEAAQKVAEKITHPAETAKGEEGTSTHSNRSAHLACSMCVCS